MVDLGSFCIDRFEAPNIQGDLPMVMQSLEDAESWCAERGKRVCRESEWERACHSTDNRRYSRGHTPDRTTCNNGWQWVPWNFDPRRGRRAINAEVLRLYHAAPSGAFESCVTPEGVHDLDGNVEEWTIAEKPGHPWRGTLKGGFWAKPWTRCNGSNDVHEPTFRFYETGFRCCMDSI